MSDAATRIEAVSRPLFRPSLGRQAILALALAFAAVGAPQAQPVGVGPAPARPAVAALPPDVAVRMQQERKAADDAYQRAKHELNAARKARIDAALDAVARQARARGESPDIARRDATAKIKQQSLKEYDTRLRVIKQRKKDAYAAIERRYGVR